MRRPRFLPRLRRAELLLLASSLLVSLGVAEVVLRVVSPLPRTYQFEPGAFVADAARGYALTPGQRTVMSDGYFREEVRTNVDGHRDPDPPRGIPRIVAIGDSQTFGHGVAVEDTWVEQLEPMIGCEVENLGVPGYGVTQYKPTLERWLATAPEPPAIVLYAMTWNDVHSGDEPADANTVRDGILVQNPRYATRPGGVRARALSVYRSLRDHVALVRSLHDASAGLAGLLGVRSDPAFDRALPGWTEKTKERLLELRALLEPLGTRLVIVHVATGNLVMPDRWRSLAKRVTYPKDFAERAFSTWAPTHGIVFADASARLEACYRESGMRRTSILLAVDAHYNRAGNRIIAEMFRDVLRAHHLLLACANPGAAPAASGVP